MVADAFLAADSAYFLAFCDPDGPSDTYASAEAVRWTEEWCAAAWPLAQNKKGITSNTASVLDYIKTQRLFVAEPARPKARITSECRSTRGRATLWRHRWGGRLGRLHPQEIIPLDVMRARALPPPHRNISEALRSMRAYTCIRGPIYRRCRFHGSHTKGCGCIFTTVSGSENASIFWYAGVAGSCRLLY